MVTEWPLAARFRAVATFPSKRYCLRAILSFLGLIKQPTGRTRCGEFVRWLFKVIFLGRCDLVVYVDAHDNPVKEDILAIVGGNDTEAGKRVIGHVRATSDIIHPSSRPTSTERNGAGQLEAEFQSQFNAGGELLHGIGMAEGDGTQGQGLE